MKFNVIKTLIQREGKHLLKGSCCLARRTELTAEGGVLWAP